jgi:spore maturation protein CgeB
VKRNISKLRYNVTHHLWNLTSTLNVLREDKFKKGAEIYLREFEGAILKAMTKDGWDGEEDPDIVQWTSTGALFYSIIVITTIGEPLYAHPFPINSEDIRLIPDTSRSTPGVGLLCC